MKIIISMVALLMFSMSSFACDEECRKQAAAKKHGVRFASYLNTKYCDDIKSEFMSIAINSLQRYRDTRLSDQRQYGMKTTRHFIDQRRDWMQECENYLSLSEGENLFYEKKTTKNIFLALTRISAEMKALLDGVTYSNEGELGNNAQVAEKFDVLFQLVDTHKTLMQLRGQVATNR